jgi:RNA polymerase sigma factor (TIGR02999 family)
MTMLEPERGDLTRWLHAWRAGDAAAFEHLSAAVYRTLHRMADRRLVGERNATLQPTELVHEAFMRLIGADVNWTDRAHFFAVVARNMRAALVDHARARDAAKRGGDAIRVTLDEAMAGNGAPATDFLIVEQALQRLAGVDARAGEAIELTYFGGLERDEIATVLSISVPTVDRALRFGRAWLARELAA